MARNTQGAQAVAPVGVLGHPNTPLYISLVTLGISGLIAGIGLFVWSYRSNPDEVQKTEQRQYDADIAKYNAKIATATGAIPPGYTPSTSAGKSSGGGTGGAANDAGAVPAHKQYITPGTLPCATVAEQLQSITRQDTIGIIGRGQALAAPLGCIKVKFERDMVTLNGDRYFVSTIPPSCTEQVCPTLRCGRGTHNLNDSDSGCLAFINGRKDQTFWIYTEGNLSIE